MKETIFEKEEISCEYPLKEIISILGVYEKMGFTSIYLDTVEEYDCHYAKLYVTRWREETDNEYVLRIGNEEKQKEARIDYIKKQAKELGFDLTQKRED